MVFKSNNCSATARDCCLTSGSAAIDSIARPASTNSASEKSSISTPAFQSLISASESPTPALMTSGRPHARYSPFFVGDEASFEMQRLINASPASAAARYEGTSDDATDNTVKFSICRLRINSRTRSGLPFVNQSKCACEFPLRSAAKKSHICSVKYQPSSEPL